MTSDASSGPQTLSLPVHDIEFDLGHQITGSYSSVAIRKRDVDVDKGEGSECIASCSLMDVAPMKHNFRGLNRNEDDVSIVAGHSELSCPQAKGKCQNLRGYLEASYVTIVFNIIGIYQYFYINLEDN